MMKLKKYLLGFITLSFIVGLLSQVSVMAHKPVQASEFHLEHIHKEEEITPYARVCAYCGGDLYYATETTPWEYYDLACVHKPYGYDNWKSRTVTKTLRCVNCGREAGTPTVNEEVVLVKCNGQYAQIKEMILKNIRNLLLNMK